jgi:hypothetical protein
MQGAGASWPCSRRRRRCLDREFQLEEIGRRGLHLAHPGLRRALGREVVGRDLNLLAAFLIGIDARLISLFVGRRGIVLLLLAALGFLRLQRGDDDRAIGPGCSILWLTFSSSS